MTTVSGLGERALIRRITARISHTLSGRRAPLGGDIVVGPGDDAAVVKPARGTFDVFTTDALVDGIHTDRRFAPPQAIGYRALAVNLSDLAAMGAQPRAALLSLVLPESIEIAEIDHMVDGMLTLAEQHHVALVGGNVTRTPGPLVIDVTAIGSVRPRRALVRSGARPGDEVYVTGTLGDAAAGLQMLQEDGDASGRCVDRYLRPEPRMRAGFLLASQRAATSCMDLSDGLADGVRQVAEASGVGITIDAADLPISEEARAWAVRRGVTPLEYALSGGDDYELMFTVRPRQRGRLRGVKNRLGNLAVTRIGTVTKERDLLVREDGTTRPLPEGFEHFR